MNKDKDSKVIFKILDAFLLLRRIRPNPHIPTAHNETLSRGLLARYNFSRVELKTFTFSSGQQSLSIDNAELGPIPKRLIFTIVKNTDFLGTMDSSPYNLGHYDLNHFSLYINSRQIPPKGLSWEWVTKRRQSWNTKLCFKALTFINRTRDFRLLTTCS